MLIKGSWELSLSFCCGGVVCTVIFMSNPPQGWGCVALSLGLWQHESFKQVNFIMTAFKVDLFNVLSFLPEVGFSKRLTCFVPNCLINPGWMLTHLSIFQMSQWFSQSKAMSNRCKISGVCMKDTFMPFYKLALYLLWIWIPVLNIVTLDFHQCPYLSLKTFPLMDCLGR